jgi:hypothetical protein
MSDDRDDTVWADPEVIFDTTTTLRLTQTGQSTIELVPPDTGILLWQLEHRRDRGRAAVSPNNTVTVDETPRRQRVAGLSDGSRSFRRSTLRQLPRPVEVRAVRHPPQRT